MDNLPNEVIRMLFENLTYRQKYSIVRTCMLWRYLILTFPNKIPKSYSFVKHIPFKEDLDSNHNLVNHNLVNQNEDLICFSYKHSAFIFDQDGQCLMNIGGRDFGDNNGQFYYARKIIISHQKQNIVVTDRLNCRVQIFDMQGNFLNKFGVFSKKDMSSRKIKGGKFICPDGMAIDNHTGNIIVNVRIQVFNYNGHFLFDFYTHDAIDKQFIHGVAINQKNRNIIMTDVETNHVKIYDCNGNFLSQFIFRPTPISGHKYYISDIECSYDDLIIVSDNYKQCNLIIINSVF